MKRAKARGAAAAAAMPLRTLRPIIFLLVSLFLVLPMFIYNFLTIDFSRISIRGAFHETDENAAALAPPLPAALDVCASVTIDELLLSDAVGELRGRCFTAKAATEVPDFVHFVYLPVQMVPLLDGEERPAAENFTLVQFAAVQSIRKALKPNLMVLHYPATEPRSYWYTQCQRHLALHRVLFPTLPNAHRSSLTVYQRRNIMQLLLALQALEKQGGIVFTDFNTIVLRPSLSIRRVAFLMGRSRKNVFSISSSMIVASAEHKHVVYLQTQLQRMLEDDDPRLWTVPLDRLLGDLLLDQHSAQLPSPEEALPNFVVTARRVLDGVPPHQLGELLTSPVSATMIHLRDSLALHLPQSDDPASHAVQDDGMVTLASVQNRIKDYDALAGERSLFGAILRYVVTANTTAELDSVL